MILARAQMSRGIVYTAMPCSMTIIPKPDVFFVHVPKTAGTSLRSLLEQYHHQDRVAPSNILLRLSQQQGVPKPKVTRTPELDALTCFHNHTNFVDFLREDLAKVTMLREPIARLNSLMNHWQQWTDKEIKKAPGEDHIKELKRNAKHMDLEELIAIDSGSIRRQFHNGMTKTLVSNFPVPEHVKLSDEQLLDTAMANLDSMDWVGVTERFDDSILLLCDYFSWPIPKATQRLNVRRNPSQQPDQLPQSIAHAVELDRAVYEHACALLDARYNELYARYEHLLSADQTLKECVDQHIRARWIAQSDSARPAQIISTMDQPLRGTGWHEREGIDSKRTYRWTGPGTESTIECLIKPADGYRVDLGIEGVIDRDIYKGLAISINGHKSESIEFERSWLPLPTSTPHHRVRALVKGQPVGDDGFCQLTIHVPKTISQEQLTPGCGDKRLKGVGVCSYAVEAID